MDNICEIVNLLLYCAENGEELPDKMVLSSRSPLDQADFDDNILTLDKITGEGMYKNCEHLDSARLYIYEEIINNNIDYNDLEASVNLYGCLKQDDTPRDDDGNLLFNTISGQADMGGEQEQNKRKEPQGSRGTHADNRACPTRLLDLQGD